MVVESLFINVLFLRQGRFTGFAKWMKKQSVEEMEHACKLADYLVIREGAVMLNKIDIVPTGWGSPLEVFEHSLEHEKRVSKMIDELVDLSEVEKDKATADFLIWFVNEQVEEEATVRAIVRKIQIAGNTAIYFVDSELGKR